MLELPEVMQYHPGRPPQQDWENDKHTFCRNCGSPRASVAASRFANIFRPRFMVASKRTTLMGPSPAPERAQDKEVIDDAANETKAASKAAVVAIGIYDL